MPKGGIKRFEVVLTWDLEVLAIVKEAQKDTTSFEVVLPRELQAILMGGEGGGAKRFHSLKRVHKQFYPVLRGAQKVSNPQFSHFVAPIPPLDNDRFPVAGEIGRCQRQRRTAYYRP